MEITSVSPVDLSTAGQATTLRDSEPSAAQLSTATQPGNPREDSFTSSVPVRHASSAPSASQAKPVAAPASSAPAQTAPASASSSQTSPASADAAPKRSAAPANTQSSASSVQVATLAASYSTTVGGQNYSASVEESGGTYVASVGNLAGVSGSGSSVQSAENNLSVKLDALV
jgi:hypothetical protein